MFKRKYPHYPLRSAVPLIRRKNPMEYRMKHQFGIRDEAFVQTMHALTGSALIPGNRVDVLCNGVHIFPSMLAAIKSARQTINMESYIYWDGQTGRVFAEALAERARAGDPYLRRVRRDFEHLPGRCRSAHHLNRPYNRPRASL